MEHPSFPPARRLGNAMLLVSCEVGPGEGVRLDAIAAELTCLAGNNWRCMETCWILLTDVRAAKVRDVLKRHLAPGDRLMVAVLHDHAAWHGFEPDHEDWLLAHL